MADDTKDLFGDFESADEAAPAKPAAGVTAEEDLFGDFDSQSQDDAGGAASASKPAKRSAADGAGAPKKKFAAAKYFEREAEEAGGSGDEEEDGNLDDLIDDSEVTDDKKGRAKLSALANKQRQELEEVRRDMAARGGDTGSRRVFGGSFLDRLEQRYEQQDEEGAAPASPALSLASFAGSARSDKFQVGKQNTFIVPDKDDPKLWCCRTFAPEKELCVALMTKANIFSSKGTEVPIYTVFFSPHLRGYIYIEAFREADIREFVRGIRGISPWGITVVPIAQMPGVFQASVNDAHTKEVLKVGDWVRAKRKPYTGDLAQVVEVHDEEVTIKMKPRIQYMMERGTLVKDRAAREARKRAAQRWFHKDDLEASGVMVNVDKRHSDSGVVSYYLVDGSLYRDGFLFAREKFGWIIKGDQVRPQQHEMQDWRLAPPVSVNTRPLEDIGVADEDRKMMPPPAFLPSRKVFKAPVELQEGDVVIVNSGELRNLIGTVTKSMYGATAVTIKPRDVKGSGDLDLAISTLSKYFEVGDYIKVVGGEHIGDVGYVMAFRWDGQKWNPNSKARILSGSISLEFEVRLHDLQLTAQKADPLNTVGEFTVGRLVHVDSAGAVSRGLMIRIEAGHRAVVLMTDGTRQMFPFQALKPMATQRGARDLWTTDRRGERISPGCVVKAPRSNAKAAPIKAEILFVHNESCFMRAEEALTGERAYLVCSGKKVEFIWNKKDAKALEVVAGRKPVQKKAEVIEETDKVSAQSEVNWLAPWFKKMLGVNEEAITVKGAAVRITNGGYKGLRGEVRDFLGDTVRLSVLAKPKLITVPLSHIAPDLFDNQAFYATPHEDKPLPIKMATDVKDKLIGLPPNTPDLLTENDKGTDPKGTDRGTEAMNDKNCWDPKFLRSPDNDVSSAPAFTSPISHAHPTHTSEDHGNVHSTPIQLPTKKKRASRIPGRAGAAAGGLSPAIPGTMPRTPTHRSMPNEVTESPSSVFGHAKVDNENEVQEMWLIVGLGVKYARDGTPAKGWIVKVYAESAVVVPDTAEVGDDATTLTLKGSETLPWHCDARGDDAVVFDGPRRGTRGKVLGIDGSVAFLRPEGELKNRNAIKFAAVAGNNMVPVERKDIAKYSRAWENAMKDKSRQPSKAPGVLDLAKATGERKETDPVTEGSGGAEMTSPFPLMPDEFNKDDLAGLNDGVRTSSPKRARRDDLHKTPDNVRSPIAEAAADPAAGYKSPEPVAKPLDLPQSAEDLVSPQGSEALANLIGSPSLSLLNSPTFGLASPNAPGGFGLGFGSPDAPAAPLGAMAMPTSPQTVPTAPGEIGVASPSAQLPHALGSPAPPTLPVSPPPPALPSLPVTASVSSEGAVIDSGETPLLPGGVTPVLPGGVTPAAGSVAAGAPGEVTPRLAPAQGGAESVVKKAPSASEGGTPLPLQPGDVTPLLPGDATPALAQAMQVKAEAGATPTPLPPKGEETPVGLRGSVGGEQTPVPQTTGEPVRSRSPPPGVGKVEEP